MHNVTIEPKYSPEEAARLFDGVRPLYRDVRAAGYTLLDSQEISYRTPDGNLIAMMIPCVFDEDEVKARYEVFKHVKGDPSNRPEIFGRGARLPRLRNDGSPGLRIGVPREVAELGGESMVLGPYRAKARFPGDINCHITSPTVERPEIYEASVVLALRVSEIFRNYLPDEYAEQMKYVDMVAPEWKIRGSAYTTVYALKDRPTAFHVDEFDIPTATGAITTAGNFTGNEFVMPEFHLAFNLQPNHILFCDVHRWHGNLPKRSGERISQVLFVRRGMHECGRVNNALAVYLDESPTDKARADK